MYSILPHEADPLLAIFGVGTSKDGGALFWYIDSNNRIRTAKKVSYKSDGHRSKEKHPVIIFQEKEGYSCCLFGEFQLQFYPHERPIILVESEKSAIIGQHILPITSGWQLEGTKANSTKSRGVKRKTSNYFL